MTDKPKCPNCGRKLSLFNRQLFTLEGGIIKCSTCSTMKERFNSQEIRNNFKEAKQNFNQAKQDLKKTGLELRNQINTISGGLSMKSTGIAYLLWIVGGLGIFGFHRFYIGKIGTGLIWLCTAGVFGVGALIDLFTLGGQVENYNTRVQLQSIRTSTESAARMNAEKV